MAMFCLLSGGAISSGADSGPAAGEVSLTEERAQDGREGIRAQVRIAAPPEVVWRVLTHYDGLSDFIPDLLVSRVIGEEEGDPLLYQQGKVRILFYVFRGSVTLRVHEEPIHWIGFSQKTGDFEYFQGYWRLEPVADGLETDVTYALWAHPRFFVPQWLLKMMLRRDIPKRLLALREHIQAIHDRGE